MTSAKECEAALRRFAARLDGMDDAQRAKHRLERTVSCTLSDLDVTFHCRLKDARLLDITDAPQPQAQIRLAMRSDDLIALVDGDLDFVAAWTSGRIKVAGGIRDLFRLRSLF